LIKKSLKEVEKEEKIREKKVLKGKEGAMKRLFKDRRRLKQLDTKILSEGGALSSNTSIN